MNQILYIGGFTLAIALFVLAVLFFIIFRVPSIHRYFRRNSRKGLVEAEVVTGKLKKKPAGPKRVTRAEYESRTEVITLSEEPTDRIDPERTDYLATGAMKTGTVDQMEQTGPGTEILDKTDIL